MRSRLHTAIFFLVSVLLASSYASCDLINPDEDIPSYLQIDSISLNTGFGEGTTDENIVDAWVYENEKLIGIFELPAVVPILKNGEADIRIRGGIKLNGLVSTRIPYFFTEDYRSTMELFPDSTIHVNPTLSFGDGVTFDWLEDLEGIGLSIESTTVSEASVVRVSGPEAFEGQSLRLALTADQDIFECKTSDAYDFDEDLQPTILEFTYRSNHSCVVGLFSRDPSGTFQVPIIVLNPSEDWNRIYLNLTDVIASNAAFIDHKPFFGFIRNEDFEGEVFVYLDNIRMLH